MQKKDTSWIIVKIHTRISQYMVRAVWCPSGTKTPLLVRIWETPHLQLTSRQYPINAHIAVFAGSSKQARSTYFRSKVSWDGGRIYGIISYSFRVYTTIIKNPNNNNK